MKRSPKPNRIGEITQQEFDREMRDMINAARWQAQEAAQEAYDREMDRW